MLHKNVLQLLMPISLGDASDKSIAIKGDHLDAAQARAGDLFIEMFPDATEEMISSWERVYGLTPEEGATLQSRRDKVVAKINERGGLSKAYYIALAAGYGYTIEILNYQPPRAGMARAGVSRAYAEEIVYCWVVTLTDQHLYYSRAGIVRAGERVLWKDVETAIESIIISLKPAHTTVTFEYP